MGIDKADFLAMPLSEPGTVCLCVDVADDGIVDSDVVVDDDDDDDDASDANVCCNVRLWGISGS